MNKPQAHKSDFQRIPMNTVSAFQQAGNPFLEKSKDLRALDSKNIANQNAVENMRKVAESGAKQFNEVFNDHLKEKKTIMYEIISKNKFTIFIQPSKLDKASK